MASRLLGVFLVAVILAGGVSASLGAEYKWPADQAGLTPGPSKSPVKAKMPTKKLTPAVEGTAPERAAFGGVWEGWMGRNRQTDIKVAVRLVTNKGAKVDYSVGSSSFGKFNITIRSRFVGDILRGTFPNGARLILGMRSDGHMNVKYDGGGVPTGIMQRTQAPPMT